MPPCIYVIGSLRNPTVPAIANQIRAAGFEAFDDWHGAGPHADDEWQRYEGERGRTFREALAGRAAQHIFQLDYVNLNRSAGTLLVLPAGKSGHLEFGYNRGRGVPSVILMPGEPERFDLMYNFAHLVTDSMSEVVEYFRGAIPQPAQPPKGFAPASQDRAARERDSMPACGSWREDGESPALRELERRAACHCGAGGRDDCVCLPKPVTHSTAC